MRSLSAVLVIATVWAFPARARAGEPGEALRERAARLLEAAADPDALAKAVGREKGDLWLIVEMLLVEGQGAGARRVAEASAGPDRADLSRYAAGRAIAQGDRAALERVLAARRLVLEERWKEAGARLAAAPDAKTVTAVYRRFIQANAHLGRRETRAAERRFEEAGGAAAELGWLAMSGRALREAGRLALRSEAFERARALLGRAAIAAVRHGVAAEESRLRALLGATSLALGRAEEALASYEHARRLAESSGDRRLLAEAMDGIGQVRELEADFPAALAAKRKALVFAQAAGHLPTVQRMHGNVSVTLSSLGRYDAALGHARTAADMADAGGDRAAIAAAYANLGMVHQRLGRMAESRRHLEHARQLAREIGSHRIEAAVLVNLGTAFLLTQEFERAAAIYERARELASAQGDERRRADALQNLAAAHAGLGRTQLAQREYAEVLKLRNALGDALGARRVELLLANAILAEAVRSAARGAGDTARSQLEEARRRLEELVSRSGADGDVRALPVAEASLAGVVRRLGDVARARDLLGEALGHARAAHDRRVLVHVLTQLAILEHGAGAWAAAAAHARQAVEVLAHLWRGNVEDYAARLRAEQQSVFALGEDAALRAKNVELAWWFLEHGRAGAFLDRLNAREAMWNAVVPEALRRVEAAAQDRCRRAFERFATIRSDTPFATARAIRQDLLEAEAALDSVLERVQLEARMGAALVLPSAAPLPRIQRLLGPRDALVAYSQFDQHLRAYVVTRETVRPVALPAVNAVEAAVHEARCEDPGCDSALALGALKRMIVAPLALGPGIEQVFLSPDGVLTYVPFSALLPDNKLVFLPNASTLDLLRATAQEKRGRGVLAVGNPHYPRSGAHRRLRPLKHSEREARTVGTELLIGRDATEARFRRALRKSGHWRAVHLAVHGLVDPQRPMWSALAMTPGEGDDGFLRPLDLLRVRVPADLVVMSACDTGRGRVYRAEGIVGLTRAFMYAGAPRVLCSLWRVDDKATQALMLKFYELWNGEESRGAALALQRAQAHVRAQPGWEHPSYWAAWVLWGLPD